MNKKKKRKITRCPKCNHTLTPWMVKKRRDGLFLIRKCRNSKCYYEFQETIKEVKRREADGMNE